MININNLNVEDPQEVNVEIGSNEVGAKIANISHKENRTRDNDKYLQDFQNSSIFSTVTNSEDDRSNEREPLNIDLQAHEETNKRKNMSFFVHQLLSKRGADEGNRKIYLLKENHLFRTYSKLLNFENDNSSRSNFSIHSILRLPSEFLKQQDIEVVAANNTNGFGIKDFDALTNTTSDKDNTFDNLHIDNSTVKFPDNNFTGIHDHSYHLNMTLDFDAFLPKFENEDSNLKKTNNFTLDHRKNDEVMESSNIIVSDLTLQDYQIPNFKTDLRNEENINLCKNESNDKNLFVASFINCSQASTYIKNSCTVHPSGLISQYDDAFVMRALEWVKVMFDTIEELRKVHLDKTSDGWKIQINDYQADLEHEDVTQSMIRVKYILEKGKSRNSYV